VASGAAIRVLSGHAAPVDGVAFSPEGKSIASCSYDGTLKLWEPQSGECLHTMRGHSGYIAAFAFTPDGSRILSVADDGELKVWEVETGRELLSLPCAGDTTDIAIAADGETVATVAKSGALTLWETALPKGGSGSTADAHAGR
jgi:WD40 repeat protein